MKKTFIFLSTFIWVMNGFAQNPVTLTIDHKLGSQAFAFNVESQNDLNHKFNVTRLEYYISGISIVHDGGKITPLSDTYLLVKANKKDTVQIGSFDFTEIESITFSVGVDPGVNNADPSKWPSAHALAPKSPSMHWGWSAGYRFVAMEGASGISLNQEFQIHALGNQNYFKQNIPVKAEKVNGKWLITLVADYNKALSGISVESGLVEHSDMNEAASCLRNFQLKVFSGKDGQGTTLAVDNITLTGGFAIYPNPSTDGWMNVVPQNSSGIANELRVYNTMGQMVYNNKVGSTPHRFQLTKPGLYAVTLGNEQQVHTKMILIQ